MIAQKIERSERMIDMLCRGNVDGGSDWLCILYHRDDPHDTIRYVFLMVVEYFRTTPRTTEILKAIPAPAIYRLAIRVLLSNF